MHTVYGSDAVGVAAAFSGAKMMMFTRRLVWKSAHNIKWISKHQFSLARSLRGWTTKNILVMNRQPDWRQKIPLFNYTYSISGVQSSQWLSVREKSTIYQMKDYFCGFFGIEKDEYSKFYVVLIQLVVLN